MARKVAIIGGGPAGLMAAEFLTHAGHRVTVYEAMPSVGRKFLLAGKSGLNISHAEHFDAFVSRYGAATPWLEPMLSAFGAREIVDWCHGLGVETFVGTSGRIFPKAMKASPLLRAWLKRLTASGVEVRTRHRWVGHDRSSLVLETSEGKINVEVDAVLLALGGASWPRLGSDGRWVDLLKAKGVAVSKMRPANCGFDVNWSPMFRERFAGAAVKSVTARSVAEAVPGEFVVSVHGIEGSLVYAHSAALRDQLETGGPAHLVLDLAPGRTFEKLSRELSRQDPKASSSNRLRKAAGLDGVKAALLRECAPDALRSPADQLARTIKSLPIRVERPRPIEEAISVAGGVALAAIDENLMLMAAPGTFVAGEMIDWEAPTGGYLLTACMATGRAAAMGIDRWLKTQP